MPFRPDMPPQAAAGLARRPAMPMQAQGVPAMGMPAQAQGAPSGMPAPAMKCGGMTKKMAKGGMADKASAFGKGAPVGKQAPAFTKKADAGKKPNPFAGKGVPKFAKGGKIDGCASKGKTKGRMV